MGDNSNYFSILIILILLVGIPWYLIRKNKKKKSMHLVSNRKEKNEVTKIIKEFMHKNNELGWEIFDTYVIKRNLPDYISPKLSHHERQNKRHEIKIRAWLMKKQYKITKKYDIKNFETFVVWFIARNPKTKELSHPTIFECDVLNVKTGNKKEPYKRQIRLNTNVLDYTKEMEWIAPFKDQDQIKNAKINEIQIRKEEKMLAKKAKNATKKNKKTN